MVVPEFICRGCGNCVGDAHFVDCPEIRYLGAGEDELIDVTYDDCDRFNDSPEKPVLRFEVALRDALHNLDLRSGASDEYCQGLLVGAIAGLMAATGLSYDELLPVVRAGMPETLYRERVTKAFRDDFEGLYCE